MAATSTLPATECPRCGARPPKRARYCPECAAPLASAHAVQCPACDRLNPIRGRFCTDCGAHLGTVAEAERRVITVLFADLTGFTSLTERLDPEHVRQLVTTCLEPLCRSVTRWGGYVDKFIGDCVMALFGAPVAYENEEERAVRAALDMHEALARFNSGEVSLAIPDDITLQLRIGINTGPVVTGIFTGGGARNYTAVGDAVNVAARLQSDCEPGRILVGSPTYDQTRHVFEFEEEQELRVKGKKEVVRARVVRELRAERGSERGFEGMHVPLVGREAEVESLRRRWAQARAGGFQHCLVVGSPGIGKSRLVRELIKREEIDRDRVAFGLSYPYTSSSPWDAVAQLLRRLCDVPPEAGPAEAAAAIAGQRADSWDQTAIAALSVVLGAPTSSAPELAGLGSGEIVGRAAEAVARALDNPGTEPRLLVFEDLHWADHATLDLLAALQEQRPVGPTLLVLVSRTALPGEEGLSRFIERIDERVSIEPLSREQSFRLVEAVLGRHSLPERFLDRTIGRADGNPLFIEEMLKSLRDRGLMVQREDTWEAAGDLDTLDIPDTVESLLSTRIDGMAASTKRVLQYASIVGRNFWSGVLADVLVRQPVDDGLNDLLHGEIVRMLPESIVEGDQEFIFQNLMLQEVAYQGLLRDLRAEMHGAVASWLERQLTRHTADADELIAFHFERSGNRALAGPYLERCALRARGRGALLDAYALARRALEVSEDDAESLAFMTLAEDLAAEIGDEDRWSSILAELERFAARRDETESLAEAEFRRARFLVARGKLVEARRLARQALARLQEGDPSGQLGHVHALLGRIYQQWGDYHAARTHYSAALPLQQAAGDRMGELALLDRLGLVEVDLDDFCRAIEVFDDVLVRCREEGQHTTEVHVLSHKATAYRWLGLYEEGVETARQALRLAEHSGSHSILATAEMTLGTLLAARGDPEARKWLLAAAERAERAGRPALEARTWLEMALLAEGADAEVFASRARRLSAAAGLVHVDILARTRQAELAVERGDLELADRLSASATRRLRRHGSIQGPEEVVLFVRARVLDQVGRSEEAVELCAEARGLLGEKADRIPDDEIRRAFLENVEPNPAILATAPKAEGVAR